MSLLPVIFLALLTTTCCDSGKRASYDYCDPNLKLCPVPSSHTMCRYPIPGLSRDCTPSVGGPLTDTEKKNVISFHNKLRSRVATGDEKNSIAPLPSASNMMQMYWDRELEAIARRWVEQCINISIAKLHDECRNTNRFNVTQNVGTIGTKGVTAERQTFRVFYGWYMQIKLFDAKIIDSYAPPHGSVKTYEDFTNLIWAESHAMGCARVVVLSNVTEKQGEGGTTTLWTFERIVCNYGPGGNIPGHPVYKRGAQCSNCPEGTSCSKDYAGLCSISGTEEESKQQMKMLSPEAKSKENSVTPKNHSSGATIEGSAGKSYSEKLAARGFSNVAFNMGMTSKVKKVINAEAYYVSFGSSLIRVYDESSGSKKLLLTAGIYLNGMCHCPDLSRFGITPMSRWEKVTFTSYTHPATTEGSYKIVREAPYGMRSGDRCYCVKAPLEHTNQAGPSRFLFNVQLFSLIKLLIYYIL